MNDKTKSDLKKLAKEANKHHQEVRGHQISAFNHARQCGEFLIKAKALVQHGNWKPWLRKNFSFSYETAADYMRICRYWNDDRLVKVRQEGSVFTSINGVLGILREERAKNLTSEKSNVTDNRTDKLHLNPHLIKRLEEAAIARCNLRDTFDHYIKTSLTIDETIVFDENFNCFEMALWEMIVDKLHHFVCCKLEYDPYEYEFSSDSNCPDLNENNVDEYLKYVKNHPQDGNNLFDRRRKFLKDKLITEVSRLRTVIALNKKKASKKRLQELMSRLTERKSLLQKIEQFMEN